MPSDILKLLKSKQQKIIFFNETGLFMAIRGKG